MYLIFISLTDYFDCPCLLCVHLRVVNLVLLRFFVFRNRTFCLSIYSGAFVSNISCDFWFALLCSKAGSCNAVHWTDWPGLKWSGMDWIGRNDGAANRVFEGIESLCLKGLKFHETLKTLENASPMPIICIFLHAAI